MMTTTTMMFYDHSLFNRYIKIITFFQNLSIVPSIHTWKHHTQSLSFYIYVYGVFFSFCVYLIWKVENHRKKWRPFVTKAKERTIIHFQENFSLYISIYVYIVYTYVYMCVRVCMCFSWAIIWSFFSRWISPFLALLSSFTFLHHFLSLKVCVSLSRKRARYLAVEDDVWLKEYNL